LGSSVSSKHKTPVSASVQPSPPTSSNRCRSSASASHGQSTRNCCNCSSVTPGSTSAIRSAFLRGRSDANPSRYCVPLRTPARYRGNTSRNCATKASSAPLSMSPTTICRATLLGGSPQSLHHAKAVVVTSGICLPLPGTTSSGRPERPQDRHHAPRERRRRPARLDWPPWPLSLPEVFTLVPWDDRLTAWLDARGRLLHALRPPHPPPPSPARPPPPPP